MAFFITALVFSGLTAFPLLSELRMLSQFLDFLQVPADSGLSVWIHQIHHGLEDSYRKYPWIAYGTDWLAFGHIVIALFFIGPMIDPRSSRWVLVTGIIACVLVFPLALICGPIRGIPFYWRLVDCSFGLFGIFPLAYCLNLLKEIETQSKPDPVSGLIE